MSGRPDRVAVVSVHGIADQQPGQTVRDLARLLCDGTQHEPRYVEAETQGVLVPVGKLEPGARETIGSTAEAPALPGAPSGFYRACRSTAGAEPDLGVALTDYLLSRHRLSERDAIYESTRVSLTRRADGGAVDLYEMYWGDLSRLRTGGVRALTALYQLFFHLNMLARDLVDQVALVAGASAGWRVLQRLHAWSAWLMTAPAALIQLAMLLLVPFGAASLVPDTQHAYLLAATFGVAAVLLAGAAVLVGMREAAPLMRWVKAAPLALGAVACLGIAAMALNSEGPPERLYFVACAVATAAAGALLVARFARVAREVLVPGLVIVGATGAALLIEGARTLPQVTTLPEWMITSALRVGEYLLAAMLITWAVLALVQIAALVLGIALELARDARVRASLYTARLGMILSAALFALLSLVLWSVITYVAGLAIEDVTYLPVLFGEGYRGAAIFLEWRVRSVGTFFTPMVAAAGLLGGAGLLLLGPSLREELAPTTNVEAGRVRADAAQWAPRLGRWLSVGRRRLLGALNVLLPLLAIAGGTIFVAFVLVQLLPGNAAAWWLAGMLENLQGEALVAAGKWMAGGALTITALGARFTQTFGRLRVALDAVLDIDNYFADPLDHQPPRARIFARFAGLLAYLRQRGYARVVIVAHSQGSVISADLLRYLKVQRRLESLVGAVPIALVTVGSPLRELYAVRFPLLYRWLGSTTPDFANAAPAAADIGAAAWVNAYRSGDYVGRAIWTAPDDDAAFGVATLDEAGRVQARRAGDRAEFCLGAGAHTHYFSRDAVALAAEIDRLIVAG